MDKDNGEIEIEGGADGFQSAARFSAKVGIDDGDKEVKPVKKSEAGPTLRAKGKQYLQ